MSILLSTIYLVNLAQDLTHSKYLAGTYVLKLMNA